MTETADHPKPSVLRRLSTLHELAQDELLVLSEQLLIQEERRGKILLPLGSDDGCTLYLLEGSCRLIAEDGGTKTIDHTDPSALAPLARLRPSHYQVEAATDVRFLRIDNGLLDRSLANLEDTSSLTLENYQVEEQDDFGHMDSENRLTLQIYEDLNAERLLLPSLPEVALRIGDAVNDEDADARSVAAVIESDPAIALKLVKAANSARFGGVAQIGTLIEAVTRLGMHNTRLLVIAFALRELFRTDSDALASRMRALWAHSRRIAALAQALSDNVAGLNANEAMLAGLVHDIGSLAVIGYARDFPEVAANPASLESSINALRTQLGGMILSKWQLPDALIDAAKDAENWYREHPGSADYADLVIVAQLHDGADGNIDPGRVTALARLGLPADRIDSGLEQLPVALEESEVTQHLLTG
jgi:HD-like signal output (HDOD) protein